MSQCPLLCCECLVQTNCMRRCIYNNEVISNSWNQQRTANFFFQSTTRRKKSSRLLLFLLSSYGFHSHVHFARVARKMDCNVDSRSSYNFRCRQQLYLTEQGNAEKPILVGLGNPGLGSDKLHISRHNVGHAFLNFIFTMTMVRTEDPARIGTESEMMNYEEAPNVTSVGAAKLGGPLQQPLLIKKKKSRECVAITRNQLLRDNGIAWRSASSCLAMLGETDEFILCKPWIPINRSGESVIRLLRYCGVADKAAIRRRLVVIHDDLDRPVGRFALKAHVCCRYTEAADKRETNSIAATNDCCCTKQEQSTSFSGRNSNIRIGGGGHLGVVSIIQSLGLCNFLRLRIGIGRPECRALINAYVLEHMSTVDALTLQHSVFPAAFKQLIQTVVPRRNKTKSYLYTMTQSPSGIASNSNEDLRLCSSNSSDNFCSSFAYSPLYSDHSSLSLANLSYLSRPRHYARNSTLKRFLNKIKKHLKKS